MRCPLNEGRGKKTSSVLHQRHSRRTGGGRGGGQTQDQVTEFLPSVTPGEPSWMLMELLALPLHKKPPNITCFSRVRRTDVLIIIPES